LQADGQTGYSTTNEYANQQGTVYKTVSCFLFLNNEVKIMSGPINIDSKGYGKIYKAIMRNRQLPLLAKTIVNQIENKETRRLG